MNWSGSRCNRLGHGHIRILLTGPCGPRRLRHGQVQAQALDPKNLEAAVTEEELPPLCERRGRQAALIPKLQDHAVSTALIHQGHGAARHSNPRVEPGDGLIIDDGGIVGVAPDRVALREVVLARRTALGRDADGDDHVAHGSES